MKASYHAIDALDETTRAGMFALFERYYAAVTAEHFESDLGDKCLAILLTDTDGELQGFSTLEVIRFDAGSGPVMVLYSGDTIISHHHWGEQTLAHAWCFFAGQIKQQCPDLPLYWFLIVKGHRTYRYLPAFTRHFYPRHRDRTPAALQSIMDGLALMKFNGAYNPQSGVVHFSRSRGHLRPEWIDLDEDIVRKPEVAFFLDRNPGYVDGDELVCLTELSDDNMRFVSRTAFLEGLNSCQDGVIFDVASLGNESS
jgi:hypothetical protein